MIVIARSWICGLIHRCTSSYWLRIVDCREWSMKRMMTSASRLAEHGPVILWSISTSRIPLLFHNDSSTISPELSYRSCNIQLLRCSALIKSHNSKQITCLIHHLPPTSPTSHTKRSELDHRLGRWHKQMNKAPQVDPATQ